MITVSMIKKICYIFDNIPFFSLCNKLENIVQ